MTRWKACTGAGLILWVAATIGLAEQRTDHCLIPPTLGKGIGRGAPPAALPGLVPQIGSPVEGFLVLSSDSPDTGTLWPSPTGDLTILAGPYDPVSQRVDLWGYVSNGWIEVRPKGEAWFISDSGVVSPSLYFPAIDIEDVTDIKRSDALGVQFYSGFTAPHWLTGSQSYRVYQIRGADMQRLPELESGQLTFVGDDPQTGHAVFAPAKRLDATATGQWVWFDGTTIVTPPADLALPNGLCS